MISNKEIKARKEEIKKYEEQIANAKAVIEAIRNACFHEDREFHDGWIDMDSYWTCNICGKKLTK